MPGASVSKDLGTLASQLQALAGRAATLDLKQGLARVGEMLVEDTLASFASSSEPGGSAWPPLKRPDHQPLVRTGRLLGSIAAAVSGNTVSVGTSLDYAWFHQFGTRTIPRRRFLGLRPRTAEQVRQVLLRAVMGQIQGKPKEG